MIVAIPKGPQKGVKELSLNWQKESRDIIQRHGFMTYPQFLDNHFVAGDGADIKWLEKNLKRFGNGLITYAVLPDYMVKESIELQEAWPGIHWIYPLHKQDEDISDFEWIGMPHREEWRNYDLNTFLKLTENKKRWYLGFWEEKHPQIIYQFDGMDTRLPDAYASKYNKKWLGWNNAEQVSTLIPFMELMEFNIISFKIALKELMYKHRAQTRLPSFERNNRKGGH